MASAFLASGHLRVTAFEGEGDHGGIQQGHQPAHGPRKTVFPLPPTHEAATLQGLDPKGDLLGQHLRAGATNLPHPGKHKGTFRCFPHL